MDIDETRPDQRPWRIIGKEKTTSITISPNGGVKVAAGGMTYVVSLEAALVLQSDEARRFLSDPAVAPFLYASSERESRIRAAKMIAQKGLSAKRRDFVAQCMSIGYGEAESWGLARLKHPVEIPE